MQSRLVRKYGNLWSSAMANVGVHLTHYILTSRKPPALADFDSSAHFVSRNIKIVFISQIAQLQDI